MGLFNDVIATMRGGAVDRSTSQVLAEVVKAVQLTGKKGSVTLKLDISKLKGGDTEIEVKASVNYKAPSEDIPMGIYYPDDKGLLHRTDQRQLTMLNEGNDRTINLSSRRMGVSGEDI